MSIKLQLPKLTDLKPRITVIGVGGAGGNAVNNMISSGLAGVDFVVANTDAQALVTSSAEQRVQLGINLTEGLGAGSKPEIGEAAAEEAIDDLRAQVSGAHMVFIACGMGGGTGTGAAAVIARVAREMGILTVGVVTKPFHFEGTRRMRIAEAGIAEMQKYVDTLIVIPNQNLFRIASEKTTFAEAFVLADQVLYSGIACIVDLIVKEGLINLDFADVRVVMSGMGSAMMGTGEGQGERRAIIAAEEAITNPLLDGLTLSGAKGLLLSIVGGNDLTLYEVDEAASRVREEVDPDANIIVGASFDDALVDRVRVSIVASGMDGQMPAEARSDQAGNAPAGVAEPPQRSAFDAPVAGVGDVGPMAPAMPAPDYAGPSPSGGDLSQRLAAAVAQSEVPPQTMAWQAPGEVLIEETVPQLTPPPATPPPGLAPASRPSPAAAAQPDAPPAAFMPAPPEDFSSAPRRMPAVEEFPLVGQRDYNAKKAPPAPPEMPVSGRLSPPEPPPAPAPRKAGFFQRLTGRLSQTGKQAPAGASRGAPRGTPPNGPQVAPQGYPQAPRGQQKPARELTEGPSAATTASGRRQPAEASEDIELPVFFNRRKS